MTVEVLVVEDDPNLRAVLSATATVGGFETRGVGSGTEAIALVSRGVGDVVLLDLGLPDYDGRELLIVLRQLSDRPIIVISGRGSERDRIEALDLGADDFIPKPFLPGELLARIRASLRRYKQLEQWKPAPCEPGLETEDHRSRLPVQAGPFVLDPFEKSVSVDDQSVHLTEAEFRILQTLAAKPDFPVSRAALEKALYGESRPPSSRIIEVYISRIRSKLRRIMGGRNAVVTVRGSGWRLLGLTGRAGSPL